MDGGTFTISNGGVFGSMFGTPIINPPQSAILGMHGIFNRPMAIKGQVSLNELLDYARTPGHQTVPSSRQDGISQLFVIGSNSLPMWKPINCQVVTIKVGKLNSSIFSLS